MALCFREVEKLNYNLAKVYLKFSLGVQKQWLGGLPEAWQTPDDFAYIFRHLFY